MHGPEYAPPQVTRRTQVTRAGEVSESGEQPLIEPIYQSSVYTFDNATQADDWFAAGQPLYARDRLPNVRTLERIVADLEHAEDAMAVASGMAAIAMTLLTLLRNGQRILIGEDGYCESTSLLRKMAHHFNLEVIRVNLNDLTAVEAALTPNTPLVLAETISNPGMRLVDLPALATLTRQHGVLLAVDNTLATPVLCQPLALGADLVIHSAGKFLGGHSDVTAGLVAGSASLISQLKRTAHLYGPVLAPMEAWLTTRGIRTLLPRVMWASQSAAQIANWLTGQSAVETVNYAGLTGHEQANLAQCLLPHGAGAVLSFKLRGGAEATCTLIRHLQVIPYVPSIGGMTTIVSFPPQAPYFETMDDWTTRPALRDTLRLSVGLEDPADIIHDLGNALATIEHATTISSVRGLV